ncbi:MAG: transmembrane anti-sigma factor [Gammaproteobacteria bacterium]|nr:MAG: transmembrane anti-sigma factor [Gammaproteobacteria bacterium]TND04061.1 MAG: transmembrane anti-sigma factor [Gammaproteobacteria bacterium]
MNCDATIRDLDEFLDGTLPQESSASIQLHANSCPACRGLLERERALRDALSGLPAPTLDTGFMERAFMQATQQHQQKRTLMRRWTYGSGGALVAGLALFVVTTVMFPGSADNTGDLSVITVALADRADVRVVVNSTADLQNATFTVSLPDNLELKGFPGTRVVRWDGRLNKGKNLLVLPVIARGPVAGELTTLVEHENKSKAFRMNVTTDGYIKSISTERIKVMM